MLEVIFDLQLSKRNTEQTKYKSKKKNNEIAMYVKN